MEKRDGCSEWKFTGSLALGKANYSGSCIGLPEPPQREGRPQGLSSPDPLCSQSPMRVTLPPNAQKRIQKNKVAILSIQVSALGGGGGRGQGSSAAGWSALLTPRLWTYHFTCDLLRASPQSLPGRSVVFTGNWNHRH